VTMPHLTNCPHQGEGRCLDCVKALHDEAEWLRDRLSGSDTALAAMERDRDRLLADATEKGWAVEVLTADRAAAWAEAERWKQENAALRAENARLLSAGLGQSAAGVAALEACREAREATPPCPTCNGGSDEYYNTQVRLRDAPCPDCGGGGEAKS
jgi:hypothetical protein